MREAIGAASFRHRNRFAVQPFDRLLCVLELRRVLAHQERIALVEGEAEIRHEADVGDVLLRGRDNRRHVAHVADVLLAGEQVVHDDRALQANLEFDLGPFRQIFLVELLAAHDDAGPGLRVVRLIADDELDRCSRLAIIDVCRERRQCHAGTEYSGNCGCRKVPCAHDSLL